ncbi:MAG TPA: cation transporter [Thermoanaerobaculia bacterium]|nr:cation transporter [Thermoanaerobaculia bacterium]
MKRSLILLAFLATPLFADSLTFKVIGIDCASCAPPVKRALASVAGVTNVKVDVEAQTATVDVPPGFDKLRLREALSNAGFDATFPGERRSDIEALPADVVKSLDIVRYDGKSALDFNKVLAAGKVTIVDYYADWCGPCNVLESRLERYMVAHPNLAIRRADIGKWNNAAAAQATHLGAEALPYIRVYDGHGKFVTSVTGGMWDEVLAAIEKASR